MEQNYDEVEISHKEIENQIKEERTDSYFDGKFLEYVGYKLLAFLITAITFGIAKPWGDQFIYDYKYSHTNYNGKRLKFEGKGSRLFVERFKWVLFTILTFGIYSLWVPIKKEQWLLSNLHFEDEELNETDSYFDGKVIQLIGIRILSGVLLTISFGLLFPFTFCLKQRWLAKHTIINRKRIVFDGGAMSLFGHYILWWFLTIITLGIYGLWVPIKVYAWQVKNTHIKLKDEVEKPRSKVPLIVSGIATLIILIGALVTFLNNDFLVYNTKMFFKVYSPGYTHNEEDSDPLLRTQKYSYRIIKSLKNSKSENSHITEVSHYDSLHYNLTCINLTYTKDKLNGVLQFSDYTIDIKNNHPKRKTLRPTQTVGYCQETN